MPNKALIVGVNKYAKVKPVSICVNSAKAIKDLLPAYGFNRAFTRTLLDGQATTAGITTALKWLTSHLRSGDQICFYFAGHGLRIAGPGGETEDDGKNEAVAPVDFDWTPKRMLLDKQIVTLLNARPTGVPMTVIFESCHSGGMSRAAPVPLTLGGLAGPHVFVSSCREESVAGGCLLGGKMVAAFTYYLSTLMRKETPWDDLVANANQMMRGIGLSQQAQLSGPLATSWPFKT